MNDIIEPTIDYDFSKLYLGPPTSLAGGTYFTRIMYNNNKLLFIQTPKCVSKQGFIKSGKKIYTDLMFDNNDTVFINWIENLETRCQELLYNKSNSWFENKLEKEDIEVAFSSPLKIYKSGKYYLLRVNVKPNIKIYDETDQIIKIEEINNEHNIISILEIQGIKFSSRNFQIEMELKQSLVVSPDPFLDECFIKKPINKKQANNNLEEFVQQSVAELNSKDLEKKTNIETIITLENIETPDTLNNKPDTLNNKPDTLNNKPDTLNNKPDTLNKVEETNLNTSLDKIISNDNNIILEVEDLEIDNPNILKEVDLIPNNNLETINLKQPNQVYYEIYEKAKEKAKEAKKMALLAFLEVKNIKKTYMLNDIEESDSDFDFSDEEHDINENEINLED
jgi:hypothetical protein